MYAKRGRRATIGAGAGPGAGPLACGLPPATRNAITKLLGRTGAHLESARVGARPPPTEAAGRGRGDRARGGGGPLVAPPGGGGAGATVAGVVLRGPRARRARRGRDGGAGRAVGARLPGRRGGGALRGPGGRPRRPPPLGGRA